MCVSSRGQLSSTYLRDHNMPVQGTYAWSAIQDLGGPVLRRHALANRPVEVSARPLWEDAPFTHEEWRTAYRTSTPEAEGPSLTTLRRAYNSSKLAATELVTRRRPWTERVRAFLQRNDRIKTARQKTKAARSAGGPPENIDNYH